MAKITGFAQKWRMDIIWAAGCFIFLLLVNLPRSPGRIGWGLDSSWAAILDHIRIENLRWGSEALFTYGPLGYLTMSTSLPGIMHEKWLMQLGLVVLFSSIVTVASLRMGYFLRVLLLLALMPLSGNIEMVQYVTILFIAAELLRRFYGKTLIVSSLLAGLFGIFALVKFTFLILCVVIVGLLALLSLLQRRWISAAVFSLPPLIVFFGGWLISGQSLLDFPLWFAGSLDIASGYSAAMSRFPEQSTLILALVGVGLYVLYLVVSVVLSKSPKLIQLTALLIGCCYLFLLFKHGFVRSDVHPIFFFSGMLPLAFLPLVAAGHKVSPRLNLAGLAMVLLAGVIGILGIRSLPEFHRPGWGYFNPLSGLSDKLAYNLRPAVRWQALEDKYYQGDDFPRLQQLKEQVKASSVDMLNFTQGTLLLNRFENYRPRRVFQSYKAYTEKLAEKNLDWISSDMAPDFFIYHPEIMDRRYPTHDDGPLQAHLFANYQLVDIENEHLLFAKKDNRAADQYLEHLDSGEVKLGEWVEVEQFGEQPIFVRIDARPRLSYRLRKLFYHVPALFMKVRFSDGETTNFRIAIDSARAGFLLHPYLESAEDISNWLSGSSGDLRVEAFCIRRNDDSKTLLEPKLRYELSAYFQQSASP